MDSNPSSDAEVVVTAEPSRSGEIRPASRTGSPMLVAEIPHIPSTQLENAALCPPGMEYLLATSMIIVKQEIELLEAFTGYETNNRYSVLDMSGRRMYIAGELSSSCLRCCMGSRRPFTILLVNNQGVTCLKISRKCTCCFCLCSGLCCNEIHVHTANDVYLGKIKQNSCDCCCPRFTVSDNEDHMAVTIKGPCCLCLCGNVRFSIHDMKEVEVGEIKKKWAGVIQETFTSADTFGVTFPWLMDPRLKTLLLGAVFLIDFMYFEKKGNQSAHQSQYARPNRY